MIIIKQFPQYVSYSCLDQNWDFLFDQIRLHNKIVSVVETWVGDSFNRQTQLPGDEFITFWESSLPVIYTQKLKRKGEYKGMIDPTIRGEPSQLIKGANCHRDSKYMDPDD